MHSKQALGLFIKAPEPGHVKTRIILVLGTGGAANLLLGLMVGIEQLLHAVQISLLLLWIGFLVSFVPAIFGTMVITRIGHFREVPPTGA